jgi:hypothetical protein
MGWLGEKKVNLTVFHAAENHSLRVLAGEKGGEGRIKSRN